MLPDAEEEVVEICRAGAGDGAAKTGLFSMMSKSLCCAGAVTIVVGAPVPELDFEEPDDDDDDADDGWHSLYILSILPHMSSRSSCDVTRKKRAMVGSSLEGSSAHFSFSSIDGSCMNDDARSIALEDEKSDDDCCCCWVTCAGGRYDL